MNATKAVRSAMKIGFFGGLANQLYRLAKGFAEQGEQVLFIRDRFCRFPFRQPIWDEKPLSIGAETLKEFSSLTWQYWEEIEAHSEWSAPLWLVDPMDFIPMVPIPIGRFRRPLQAPWKTQQHIPERVQLPVIRKLMDTCDVLVVSGVEGTLQAARSGKPYIIFPHGGDIRRAAGFEENPGRNFKDRFLFKRNVRSLRRAYARSLWVGSYDLAGTGAQLGNPLDSLPPVNVSRTFIPVTITPRPSQEERRKELERLLSLLGRKLPVADWFVLSPARINYFWNGNGLFLEALAKSKWRQSIHLFLCAWGEDIERAKNDVARLKLEQQVTFLPFVFSRPLLSQWMQSVDWLVDSLVTSSFGLNIHEAMGLGVPVVGWVDQERISRSGEVPPPILSARSEEELLQTIDSICSLRWNLEERGKRGQDWAREERNAKEIVEDFKGSLVKYFRGSDNGFTREKVQF